MSSFTNWDQQKIEESKMVTVHQEDDNSSTKPKSNHPEFDSFMIIKDDEKNSERNFDDDDGKIKNFRENNSKTITDDDDELTNVKEEEPKNVQNLKKRVSDLKNGLELMKNEFLILRGNYSRLEITHSKKFYRKKKNAMKQELYRILSELNEEQKSQDFAYHTKNIKSVDNSLSTSKNHQRMTSNISTNNDGFCYCEELNHRPYDPCENCFRSCFGTCLPCFRLKLYIF